MLHSYGALEETHGEQANDEEHEKHTKYQTLVGQKKQDEYRDKYQTNPQAETYRREFD